MTKAKAKASKKTVASSSKKTAPQKKPSTTRAKSTTTTKSKSSAKAKTSTKSAPKKTTRKPKNMQRVCVKFDVGFNNSIYLRGNGAGLSWTKGVLLENRGANEWVWETDQPTAPCEFKVLINDELYEGGENHHLESKQDLEYTPFFPGW